MLAKATSDALQDYRDVANGRFLKLVDGGLTDNFGLSSIQQSRLLEGTPLAPLDEAEAMHIRRLLFVVVDGGNGAAPSAGTGASTAPTAWSWRSPPSTRPSTPTCA